MDEHTENQAPIDHALAGIKVLIAEDDPLLAGMLGKRLTTAGGTLYHEADGARILEIVREQHPDIVVLDIMLPGMNGYDVLKTIKADDATKDIPVLLLSNLGQEEDIQKSRELGAADFMIKATVSLDEVVEKIIQVLFQAKTK
ncbi:MAG: response regulator receiver modulated metal dependent phosphohydrolase [Parcubacteria group bacterium Gr01-1014_48]|nr:MAG: response regulator receiver modulated metal dependent phosphohydrolase [Parcubacteria group bacterium Greene0416_14]TSC74589.1 MAG: response regulator receiver modulated metal dependent phosphohydrolase [Parcubacteria group bacterium Gr01-1014_48]TSD01612.1 MAG: response regulator receiver modulated metal dependent phosphohydrolase [Parcubacteria group bacterium Greene1014_15]